MMTRRHRPSTRRLLVWLALFGTTGMACDSRVSDRPRNVILIVTDTLRADHLSISGGPVPTPHLDELARRGVRFQRAYSHIPVTGPSHTSMFTGLLPLAHGVEVNAQPMPEDNLTLAEILSSHGYHTRAAVSLGVLRPQFGFDQGFDTFDDSFRNDYFRRGDEITDSALEWLASEPREPFFLWLHYSDPHEPYSPPTMVHPEVAIWLGNRHLQTVAANGYRHFIDLELAPGESTLHFTRPRGESNVPPQLVFRQVQIRHEDVTLRPTEGWVTSHQASSGGRTRFKGASQLPATLTLTNPLDQTIKTRLIFFSHEDYSDERIRELYAGETRYLDQQIGRIVRQLDSQKRWRDTIVVFTADHGEGLGEHGRAGHIDQLYDSMLRVPLIVVARGLVPADESIDLPVRHIDLLPTILDLAGFDPPRNVHGTSLAALMTGAGEMQALPVMGSTYRPLAETDLRSLIRFPHKYILDLQTGDEELYDLRLDPGELHNLIEQEKETAAELRLALEQSIQSLTPARGHGDTPEVELSQEEIEKLEALGYVN